MAKNANNADRRSEPVDATTVPQASAAEKPSREALAKSGYTIPEAWERLEQGETLDTVDPVPLSQVNREADAKQRESLKAEEGHSMPEGAHKSYTGHYGTQPPGQKAASGPDENKSEARSTSTGAGSKK